MHNPWGFPKLEYSTVHLWTRNVTQSILNAAPEFGDTLQFLLSFLIAVYRDSFVTVTD